MYFINSRNVDIPIRKMSDVLNIKKRLGDLGQDNVRGYREIRIDVRQYLGTDKVMRAILHKLCDTGVKTDSLYILGIRSIDKKCCELLSTLSASVITLGSDELFTACVRGNTDTLIKHKSIIFVFNGRWIFDPDD